VYCVLCRFLLGRIDPDWLGKAETLHGEYLLDGLNNDTVFSSEANSTRLREIYALSQSRPSDAFVQFLALAEQGSVWSMIQIGHAYEVGRGVRVDRVQAEHWYTKAYEEGSDYGLLRGSVLAARRGDVASARAMLEQGVARGLARAMAYLAWLELKFSRGERGRRRARELYERAITLGDFDARVSFGRAMAHGRFGLAAIPEGFRRLQKTKTEFFARIEAQTPTTQSAGN
jgi:TPR repeat protein